MTRKRSTATSFKHLPADTSDGIRDKSDPVLVGSKPGSSGIGRLKARVCEARGVASIRLPYPAINLKSLRRSSALAGIVIKLRNSLALGVSGRSVDKFDEVSD